MRRRADTKRLRIYCEGNREFHLVSVIRLVSDPQFRSGYRDRLRGLPPRRFYYDEKVGERQDTWGYERGRLVAAWLQAMGQKPPAADDILGLAKAYYKAEAADVVL
jgi:hypothetical protein